MSRCFQHKVILIPSFSNLSHLETLLKHRWPAPPEPPIQWVWGRDYGMAFLHLENPRLAITFGCCAEIQPQKLAISLRNAMWHQVPGCSGKSWWKPGVPDASLSLPGSGRLMGMGQRPSWSSGAERLCVWVWVEEDQHTLNHKLPPGPNPRSQCRVQTAPSRFTTARTPQDCRPRRHTKFLTC